MNAVADFYIDLPDIPDRPWLVGIVYVLSLEYFHLIGYAKSYKMTLRRKENSQKVTFV
jgi:hypothetical protein